MITVNSPIIGFVESEIDDFLVTPKRVADWNLYVEELYRLCGLVGFDFRILFAQAAHETADFTSHWWEAELNPAGIGIFDDGSTQRMAYSNGTDAARAHVVHMIAYVDFDVNDAAVRVLDNYHHLDPRYQAVIDAEFERSVRVLGDLGGGRWATDPKYAEKIAAKANAIFGVNDSGVSDTTGGASKGNVMTELRVILNPGHRNATGGNPQEAAFTDDLERAYFNAFSSAGYETVALGDTQGGLDAACRRMAAQIASASGPCVLLDLHLEGSPAPGVFCIVPDVTGLRTNAPVEQDPADTWTNNSKDRELAKQISNRISAATGLKLRTGIRAPGIMDESETGVGAQGFRLATFAYTSPHREKAVRLVVEHGNHTIQPDKSIIFAPGFADKCAKAAVAAVKAVYGNPGKPPKPKPVPFPIDWKRGDVGFGTLGGHPREAYTHQVTAKRETPLRQGADSKSPETHPRIKAGEKAVVVGVLTAPTSGGGKASWFLVDIGDGTFPRASASAFTPMLPRP